MAIQNRRGQYADFDPSKAVAGELLTVLNGDPKAKDGKAVYMAFASSDVKRLATYEDMLDNIENASEEIAEQITEEIEEGVADSVQAAQTAATTATTKASEAAASAASVSASASQIATNTSDISDLKSAMDDAESSIESLEATKADIDGFYEDMTVGTAEAVLSEKFTADSVPYHFRKTPYGDRLREKIIGGTVAWNQLQPISNLSLTLTNTGTLEVNVDNDGTLNIIGTNSTENAASVVMTVSGGWASIPANHVLLILACNYNGFEIYRVGHGLSLKRAQGIINKSVLEFAPYVGVRIEAGETVNIHSKFISCDLTAMFGTAIADYIYNLEQTTEGAGVALFRELFPKDYYEYDAGSLQSVSGLQSHDEVGFNQWDEETNIGYWDVTNGSYDRSPGQLCSKNYIPVFPNATYYAFKGSTTNLGEILFYDKEKNYITHFLPSNWINRTFVTPSNCHYITFNLGSSYGTTYNHDICINISDPEKNGTYEPYKKHSYPLDSSLTLRGVPKLVDNEIKFDGDIYESDGKVTRRYGIVDLGTLTWSQADNVGRASALLPHNSTSVTSGKLNVISTKYITGNVYSVSTNDKCICTTKTSVWVQDSSFINATASEFKSAMSGIYLVYELETPTEESAQPFTNPQRCAEGGAEEYVTTGIVPVGHESEYYENIATKVDGLPYDLSMIAPIENGTTASKAYSAGQYFLHNDQFCKAKTAIASGATFTLNTNYEVTTVANELYTALH